jgi:hypothetical protein
MISSHQSVGWLVGQPVTIKLLVRRSVYSLVQASPDMVDVYLFWLKMMTLRSLVSSVSPARIGRWFSITSSDSLFAIHHPCLGTKNLTGSRPLIWLTSHPILNHTRNEEIHAGLNIGGHKKQWFMTIKRSFESPFCWAQPHFPTHIKYVQISCCWSFIPSHPHTILYYILIFVDRKNDDKPTDKPMDTTCSDPKTGSVPPRRRFFTSPHRPCATSAGRSQCRAGWSRLWTPLPRLLDGLNVLTMCPVESWGKWRKLGTIFSGYFLEFHYYLMNSHDVPDISWYVDAMEGGVSDANTPCACYSMLLCWVCWSWFAIFSPERTLSIVLSPADCHVELEYTYIIHIYIIYK